MSDSPPSEERKRNAMIGHLVRRGIPILVLLLVVGGSYLYWSGTDSSPAPIAAAPPRDPVAVNVVTVERETVPVQMQFLGQTEASQVVQMRARVAGYLQERTFREGEQVSPGEKLFQIDPRPFDVALAEARAGVVRSQAVLTRAQQRLARVEELRARAVASQEEIDEARADVAVAEAEVQLANARVAAAQLDLGYTSIEAPITGLIGQALQDTGSYVDSGQTSLLAVIQQVDPMYVRYSVTETEMLRYQRQIEANELAVPDLADIELEIVLSDGSIYPHRGHINFLAVEVDETTGTSVVRGEVPNPEGLLKPGQFIHARVLGITRINVIRVPLTAVTQSPEGAHVMVVDDAGLAQQRPVVLGQWSGTDYWIIDQGLQSGDRVIIDRLMSISPGTPVTIESDEHTGAQATDAQTPASEQSATDGAVDEASEDTGTS